MNKFLGNVAAGVMSTVIIVLGVKVIYNELPDGTKTNIERKTRKAYKAVKESLTEKNGGTVNE